MSPEDQEKIAAYIANIIEKIEAERDEAEADAGRFADAVRNVFDEYDRNTVKARNLRFALAEHNARVSRKMSSEEE